MKISKLLRISPSILFSLLLFQSSPSFAFTESIPDQQQHGDWFSFTKEDASQKTSHIVSQAVNSDVLLIFDFITPDLYVIELYKGKSQPTQLSTPNIFLTDASVFVDNSKLGNYQSRCTEFEEYYECFLPQAKNDEIVENFKRGYSVRILINGADLNYSMNGFYDAFFRAKELIR